MIIDGILAASRTDFARSALVFDDMHMRMFGVVMRSRNPLETRPKIGFHSRYKPGRTSVQAINLNRKAFRNNFRSFVGSGR